MGDPPLGPLRLALHRAPDHQEAQPDSPHQLPRCRATSRLHFHDVDNPQIIAYSKTAPGVEAGSANVILTVVNLDPLYEQAGWLDLDLKHLGIAHDEFFDVEDLLTGVHYQWHDRSNYVALRPQVMPAHIFRINRKASAADMLDIRTI